MYKKKFKHKGNDVIKCAIKNVDCSFFNNLNKGKKEIRKIIKWNNKRLSFIELFNLYNSPLVKFFSDKVLDITYDNETQSSSLHHGELHVVNKLDKIPDTDEMETLGFHSGLFSHENLKML